MSFDVHLYAFSKEVNSTKQPQTNGTTYQCVTNTDFDALRPAIPLNIGTAANPTQYNYCYIPAWSRYYWISSWTFEGGLWCANCSVDPLASWKTQIGATSAYVLRAAAESDGDIIDTLYPRTSALTTENDIQANIWDLNPLTTGSYVVGVLGQSTINYYTLTPATMWAFMKDCYSQQYYTDALGFFAITNQDLKLQVDPMQYIASVVWLPFTAPAGDTANSLYVGTVDIVAINGIIYKKMAAQGYSTLTTTFTVKRHPLSATRGSWVNAACAEYSISIPPFGVIHLDPAQIANTTTVRCIITVDHRTGAGILNVYAERTDRYTVLITRMTGQVGVTFPMSHITTPGAALASSVIPAVQALGGIASTIGSAASRNAMGMAGGIGTTLGSVASALGDIAQTKIGVPHTTGGTPSVAQLSNSPQMDYIWYSPVDEDNTHRGRPLCQVRRLDTLPGYQLCTDTDVSIPATREEIDTIRGYLEGGYYYE